MLRCGSLQVVDVAGHQAVVDDGSACLQSIVTDRVTLPVLLQRGAVHAGLAATTITAPVDVVKTHMYCAGSKYTSPLQCAGDIMRREGLRGFFKGWTANYARLGPQTTIMFVVMEKMRYLAGMKGL